MAPDPSTGLGELVARFETEHEEGLSGFSAIDANQEALALRLALVDSAEKSLDLQYYVWWGDESGNLLMKRVIDAADRGVKVRLIYDDVGSSLSRSTIRKLKDSGIESYPYRV